jgi:hypothetical protein
VSRHWRKLILAAHFEKNVFSIPRENTFGAQLILALYVLCTSAAKYIHARFSHVISLFHRENRQNCLLIPLFD